MFPLFFSLTAVDIDAQTTEKIWDYPVKPGSKEWASFTTTQQMLDAVQIPQNVLEKLSTKELAEICFNYPFYIDYNAIDDQRLAISIMIELFNGLKELSQRKDGAKELKAYPVMPGKQDSPTLSGHSLFKLSYGELLLADDSFIKQLNTQQLNELEKIVLDKYVSKVEKPDLYSLHTIKQSFLLSAVIIDQNPALAKTKSQKETAKRFIENYNVIFDYPELITEISKIVSGL